MSSSGRSSIDLDPSLIRAATARRMGDVVVRDTPCRSILNRSGISDYSLNCYTGCAHGCIYCYARFMQRFHPHPEPWGRFVDVKVNAVEVLKRRLRRAPPGAVFVSSACDGWQPVEAELGLTRRCCELLLERGFDLHILTKSALLLRDLDILGEGKACVGVTLTTLDEAIRKEWEPRAGSVADRLDVLRSARAAGLETSVMFGPLLPLVSDTCEAIEGLLSSAVELGVETIYVDALNPRPRVWASVCALLGRWRPDLTAPYRRILFDRRERRRYLAALGRRVRAVARDMNLADRLRICF